MSYAPEDWTLAALQFAASRGDAGARAEYERRTAFVAGKLASTPALAEAYEEWRDEVAALAWCPQCSGLRVREGVCQDCGHECE
jgi:hypothetical protein